VDHGIQAVGTNKNGIRRMSAEQTTPTTKKLQREINPPLRQIGSLGGKPPTTGIGAETRHPVKIRKGAVHATPKDVVRKSDQRKRKLTEEPAQDQLQPLTNGKYGEIMLEKLPRLADVIARRGCRTTKIASIGQTSPLS